MRPAHWLHHHDHFFKYVTVETAQVILQSRTLRWSSVSCFNDPFDGQFRLQLEIDENKVVEAVLERHWNVLTGAAPSKAKNKLGALLNYAAPHLAGKMNKEEFFCEMRSAVQRGIENGAFALPAVHDGIQSVLADFKFLCLTESNNSLLMWSHYAHHHTGAVLRFSCLPERDSLWGVAQPVKYPCEMPRLMTQDQFIDLLSGDFSLETHLTLDSIVFTKAEDWSYEKEWRVAMPGTNISEKWQHYSFHPSELTAVYFGCNMPASPADAISNLVAEQYSHAELWAAQKSATKFALEFDRLR